MTAKNLKIDQLSRRMAAFSNLPEPSAKGWIYAVRTVLNMSYRQLAKRLGTAPQSAQGLERREMVGTITVKNLRQVAEAMNMKLVYGFVPRNGSLEKVIEEQALAVARKIVLRTDTTMKLEDQGIQHQMIEKYAQDLANEIKQTMPRYLWD